MRSKVRVQTSRSWVQSVRKKRSPRKSTGHAEVKRSVRHVNSSDRSIHPPILSVHGGLDTTFAHQVRKIIKKFGDLTKKIIDVLRTIHVRKIVKKFGDLTKKIIDVLRTILLIKDFTDSFF